MKVGETVKKSLFVNGTFITLDEKCPIATAVYVEDDMIKDVGEASHLRNKYVVSPANIIDLQGQYVLPGLTDSHMHLIAHGLKLKSLDFSNCESALEMKQLLQQKIESTPPGEWIVGRGWNENNFDDQKIFTKEELDEMSKQHPMFLTRICGHAHLVNSVALCIAKVGDDALDPPGGKLVRNESGQLTGLLLEHAGDVVQQHVPKETYNDLKDALLLGIKDCWRLGLVGCHTEDVRYSGGFNQTYRLFDEVLHQESHPFRVHQLIYHEHIEEMIQSPYERGDQSRYFCLGAMKIFADGAMGGRSALLSEPYADDPTTNGVAIQPQEQLNELVKKARQHYLPIAVHTIGDLALEMTLNAIEQHRLHESLFPDRIIHAQVLRPELVERMKKLPLIIDIQPRFLAADFPWVIERLGKERSKQSYAWKTLLDAGLTCAGGSDAPIEPVDPLLGLHAAVTRIRPDEPLHEGYNPEQKLTPTQALHLFTTGSARTENKEHLKGTITVGKYADFTVLNKNLLETNPHEWLTTDVQMTVVGGNVVFEK